ncbi:hypothetical protein LTS07_007226 [Exophiala sideris]|uniref:Uncharacterized protein n=1 Tax=Exophiala sideris TaxID=1016849 RepID=A0ABR0J5T4_9EURO|nr:hypothetical protein LTS07_007226 [Exophiala sideris]KAK5033931.1 hypothetical protein LTR13_006531 [Exophiala sideris]KAK5055794.1 hypothetical protein LTR69_008169 [Exophiala sideris]KAK5180873.1 hypothetical protein LTR44_006693 [Eurotiomycetes sp. CCFEE 6388]
MAASKSIRSIVLTGAGSGIGLACLTILLSQEANAHVVAVDVNGVRLVPLKEQYPDRLEVIIADIAQRSTSEKAVEKAVSSLGRLDALLLNAGVVEPVGPVATAKVDEWKRLFDVNFFSMIHTVQVALPHLRKHCGMWKYCCDLFWGLVNALVAGLAMEEPEVACLSVTPGIAESGLQKQMREELKDKLRPDMHKMLSGLHARGELLKPEQPGSTLARLAVQGVPKEISGQMLPWNDDRIV